MSRTPIADYALISDCHSAALVSRAGSVDWLCFPRFDAPAIFARLLDDQAGSWSLRPAGAFRARRRYVGQALVLETTFETPGGEAVLTDALAVGPDERGHELGSKAPHALLRRLQGSRGAVEFELDYSPRPEFGFVRPLLEPADGGLFARGGASFLMLSTPLALSTGGSSARGRFTLRAGESVAFALQHAAADEGAPRLWGQEEIGARLADTAEGWRTWSELHQGYEGPWRDLVHQSGRVLQGLTYFPTGAIVAAATTSLPESVGAERNWDYRFTWVRDASLTLEALWVAACPDEAQRFFDFLAGAAFSQLQRASELQIMFGIAGERDLSERVLPWLSGWRDSRPVRVGNGAFCQRQLDVYGELMGAVARLRAQLSGMDSVTRSFLVEVAQAAAARWKEKDQGIWEVRSEPRHYVHSKVMCWLALDCALQLKDLLDAGDHVARWAEAREEIAQAVLQRGWSERAGAFAQAFDSDDLDASNLLMPIVGFLPPDDPRIVATLRAIEERLTDSHGLVYRYRTSDGLSGREGTFLPCTFWLAHAWALAGEMERASEVFNRAASFANDVGLFSEEVEPGTRELLGNFPQAFSHIGLINAAWAISQAERQRFERPLAAGRELESARTQE
jgi:GH15 family glucan-1,4-alpha-glucosidase